MVKLHTREEKKKEGKAGFSFFEKEDLHLCVASVHDQQGEKESTAEKTKLGDRRERKRR